MPQQILVQESPSASFDRRCATTSFFMARGGINSAALSGAVSQPNSAGTKRRTPAATAASMMVICALRAAMATAETTASWPARAVRREGAV